MRKYWVISSPPCKADINKEMNKEKDFVYLVTVVKSTLSMMFGWLTNSITDTIASYNGYRRKNGLMITYLPSDFHSPNLEMLSHLKVK